MNARTNFSIVGLSALLALGAPALAAAGDQQEQDVRTSLTEVAPGILPDQSDLSNTDSAIKRNGAGHARVLWISWLMRLSTF